MEEVGDPYRIDHTVQVTSFGGAGTTALLDHLIAAGADLQKGPAQWPFNHWRWPPASADVRDGFRRRSTSERPSGRGLSIFRRDLQLGHYAALHDAEPDPEIAERLADLETFLHVGVDHFGLADHVSRWSEHPSGYPVLFVHYDDLETPPQRLAIGNPGDPRSPRCSLRRTRHHSGRPPPSTLITGATT